MHSTWTDEEPTWRDARMICAVALARARTRWALTLLIATIGTALVVLWQSRHPRRYEASIVVRVTESEIEDASTPRPSHELTSFVSALFLTRATLLSLMETHDLYADKRSLPDLAMEAMRDHLSVEVVQNYFEPERHIANPVRSARIVISYLGEDPDVAQAVVRDLGQRIADEQTRLRRQSSQLAAASAETAERALVAQLLFFRSEQARLNLTRTAGPLRMVQLAGIGATIAGLEHALNELSDRSARLELQSRFEAKRFGMRFEVVDTGQRPQVLLNDREHLAVVGSIAFVLWLPISVLGVGTLGRRVHDPRTLRRLGIEVLGTVPWPPTPTSRSTAPGRRA